MKVLFLTKYSYIGASSRYRTFQYLPYLKENGIDFDIKPLFNDEYLKHKYSYSRVNILLTLKRILKRIKTILIDSHKYDLIVVEKEIIPYFPPLFEYYLKITKRPYIVDYDDAVWHNYDNHRLKVIKYLLRNKIKKVMKLAEVVIGGSDYIVNYAKYSGAKKIEKIPTVINLEKYKCKENEKTNELFVVGWIGSPSTSKYIITINEVLAEFTKKYDAIVHLIGFDKKLEKELLFSFTIIDWNEDTEVQEICKFDVGIMPLIDGPFERGKCGFKLIQYMGCRKPVIASPIGENNIIVEHGINGYLANNPNEFLYYLIKIYNDKNLRKKLGENGYRKFFNQYSLKVAANDYLKIIKGFDVNENGISFSS